MLTEKYNHKESEKKWQEYWRANAVYKWRNDLPREQTFVIDTPPPTVSGLLHMGHVFSYTQADFVARFWRMRGKDVFYPMGFDDNGLPTERLVEKEKNIRVAKIGETQNEKGPRLLDRESFIKECKSVVEEAETEFESLFNAIALSVDWNEKYQTISPESQKISQMSFVDLCKKGLIKREFQPVFWDCVDKTALSQADIIDKELESSMNYLDFAIDEINAPLSIMTTRPELLPACVAVMINANDKKENGEKKWAHLLDRNKLNEAGEGRTGYYAITPVFGVKVPIIADNLVKTDKGTGAVMCCTFGDETDKVWWGKHKLEIATIIEENGLMKDICSNIHSDREQEGIISLRDRNGLGFYLSKITNISEYKKQYDKLIKGKKIKQAREAMITHLADNNLLLKSEKFTHAVKCAERSGAPIEMLLTPQWFIKIADKKEALKQKAQECNWHPEYMRVRIEQWIDGLSHDWCISRQRFFGVPIPAWFVTKAVSLGQEKKFNEEKIFVADFDQLPCDPLVDLPKFLQDFKEVRREGDLHMSHIRRMMKEGDETEYFVRAETNILDTWATSSISPQLSSGLVFGASRLEELYAENKINPQNQIIKGETKEEKHRKKMEELQEYWNEDKKIHLEKGIDEKTYHDFKQKLSRHEKLFPADMRPQAHEIIRSWAFYTIVKAHLHSLDKDGKPAQNLAGAKNQDQSIPWKNLMISGWCLASDKTKMSKSKGNVVTPTSLIEEKSSDIVRYWASTSHLGADTAYSEDVFKIGQKLVTKLFNAAKFVAINFDILNEEKYASNHTNQGSIEKYDSAKYLVENKIIFCAADLWILSRLHQTIENATSSFEKFEYARAREKIEEFFWHDFCDNYLEIVKVRSYGVKAEKLAGQELNNEEKQQVIAKQLSGIHALKICLKTLLKLFAPFIPHICEEIYAGIFAQELQDFALQTNQAASIHARGNWPKIEEFAFEQNACNIGEQALAVIFQVRKFKSDNNLSMKTTIQKLTVQNPLDLSPILEDLANVCNAIKIDFLQEKSQTKVEIES